MSDPRAQNGYPAPGPTSAVKRTGTALLGIISLVLAAAAVVVSSSAQLIANAIIFSRADYSAIQVIYGTGSVIGILLSLAAIVLGIIALLDKSQRRLAAAAGTAIAASFVFSTVISLASSALVSLVG